MKFSVALAAYNGEKFIEKQVRSILNQTVAVDELIVSDDGSTDKTLSILSEINDPRIKIIVNNRRHGCCGNFENALLHCSGDYIFLSDQDDIWLINKVERIKSIILKYPDIDCVLHSASLIDKNDNPIDGDFESVKLHEGKLTRKMYLERSVSGLALHGMSMCISRRFLEDAIPFPDISANHDNWLAFCAMCNDSFYYLNEVLALYRLHGNNTAGNSAYTGNIFDKLKKINRAVVKEYNADFLALGNAMRKHLEKKQLTHEPAYRTAMRICDIGSKEQDAFSSGRITGLYKLLKLYCTDVRYRRSNPKAIIANCLRIIMQPTSGKKQ